MPPKKRKEDMYPRALNKRTADMLGVCWSCESKKHKAPWHHGCSNHLKKAECCNLTPAPGQTVWDLLEYPRKPSNKKAEQLGVCWSCGEMGHMYPWCVTCQNHCEFRPFQVQAELESNAQMQSEQPSQNQQSQEEEQEMQEMSQDSLTQSEAAEASAVDVVIPSTMEATQDPEAASQTQTATGSQPQLGTWTSPRVTKAIDRLSPTHGKSYDDAMSQLARGGVVTNLFPGKELRNADASDSEDTREEEETLHLSVGPGKSLRLPRGKQLSRPPASPDSSKKLSSPDHSPSKKLGSPVHSPGEKKGYRYTESDAEEDDKMAREYGWSPTKYPGMTAEYYMDAWKMNFDPDINKEGPELFVEARNAGYNPYRHNYQGGVAVFLEAKKAGYDSNKHDDAGGPQLFLTAVRAGYDPNSGDCLKAFLLTLGIDPTASESQRAADSNTAEANQEVTNLSSDSDSEEEGDNDVTGSKKAADSGTGEANEEDANKSSEEDTNKSSDGAGEEAGKDDSGEAQKVAESSSDEAEKQVVRGMGNPWVSPSFVDTLCICVLVCIRDAHQRLLGSLFATHS